MKYAQRTVDLYIEYGYRMTGNPHGKLMYGN